MINAARLERLESITLLAGSHESFQEGVCAMELVAWLAEEPHSDAPQCTCPVLGAFVQSWNDSLNYEDRNRLLKPLLPKLVGTRSTPEIEKQRSYLALDWMIREFLPTWLEQVDALRAHAAEIRALEVIRDMYTAGVAGPKVRAAGAAAWDVARYAEGYTAWDVARYAEGYAAGAAARCAEGYAAGTAAREATLYAATQAVWDAAGAAAWDAIPPTVERLQVSALSLVERMIACE